jgi:hypothetical protein
MLEGRVSSTPAHIVNDSLAKIIASSQNQSNFYSKTLKDRLKEAEDSLARERGEDTLSEDGDPETVLVDYILRNFRDAKEYRRHIGIDDKFDRNWLMYNAQYSDEERARILEQKSVDMYYPLAQRMVLTMVAFLRKTLAGGDIEHPQFDLEPTTIPDPPPQLIASVQESLIERIALEFSLGIRLTDADVEELLDSVSQQLFEEARRRAVRSVNRAKMELDDKLQEAEWGETFDDMLEYLCTYGVGIVCGPQQKVEKRQYFTQEGISTRNEYHMDVGAIDPRRFWFSEDSTTTQDGSFVIHVTSISRKQLMDMRYQPGFISEAIDTVLAESATLDRNWCSGMSMKMPTTNSSPSGVDRPADEHEQDSMRSRYWGMSEGMDMLKYHGCAMGNQLMQAGVSDFDGKPVVAWESYEIEAYMIGRTIIYIRCNVDPLCERPYTSSQLFSRGSTPYGFGVIDPIEDIQRLANVYFRASAVNAAYSQAPMGEIDEALLSGANTDRKIKPNATILKNSEDTGLSGQALHIHYMESRAAEFITAIDRLVEHAELVLGLPRFLLGHSSSGGAAETLGGLNQLTSNAFVQLRSAILNIDNGIVKPFMKRLHRFIINRTDNDNILGDVEVITLGAGALLAREVNQDRLLAILGTFLPLWQANLVTVEGILEIVRRISEVHGFDPELMVPDPEGDAIDQALLLQRLGAIPGFNGGQAAAATPGGTLGVPGGAALTAADPLAATGGQVPGSVPGQIPEPQGLAGTGSLLDPQVRIEQRTLNRR